ncbi:Synaptic vesicle 2-related protein like [Argiope bruennichi]|uniref:Synaptic vesicle 2-related protein like n=1 Tax=Argiope bruennichi TaxID=94029 RepID=A0A8T0ER39_ARGBR|nr:Synaptic vesicle 2-related protein like [Argiope bruennichi]
MVKDTKTDDSEDTNGPRNKEKSNANSKEKESITENKNLNSQPVADEKAKSSDEHTAARNKITDSWPTEDEKIKLESDTESLKVDILSSDESVAKKVSDSFQNEENSRYYIDDVVNKGGYGKFQKLLTFLAGLGWFADAFEIVILSYLGDFLACEWTIYRWENATLTSMVFMGMMVGSPSFGVIADIYGRKISLGLSALLLFSFGAGSTLSPNIETLIIVRGLMGISLGGVAQGVTLCCEYYPAADRGIAGFYLTYYWATGTMLLILGTWGMMKTVNNWRWLLFGASLPALTVFLAYKWYPESARYYLVSQQHEKAVKQLEQLARLNNIEMPKGDLKLPEEEARGRIWDLFKPELRVSTLLMWYLWFAIAFTYYAFALIAPIIIKNGKLRVTKEQASKTFNFNHTSSFLESKIPCREFTQMDYIDLLWTSAAEFPGLLVFTFLIKFLNRKTLLWGSCLLTTLATFLLLVDTNHRIVSNLLLFFGRANLIALYQLLFIMTTEAFPTTLRAIALGSGSGLSNFGGAVVPFAAQFLVISEPVTTVCIIGFVIFLAAVFAFLLPQETKDINLKETSKDYIKPQ